MDPYYLVVCEKTTEQEEREPQVQKTYKSEVLQAFTMKPVNTTDNILKAEQHVLHPGSVSYADVAAGRTSPCAFDKSKEHFSPGPITQFSKSEFTSNQSSSNNDIFDFHHYQKESSSLSGGQEKDSIISQEKDSISAVLEVPVTCPVEIIEPQVETHIALHKNYNSWTRLEQNNLESDVLPQGIDRQLLETESFHSHQHRHVWAPGSLTYADILRGKHGLSSDFSDNQRLSADCSEIAEKCNQSREEQSDHYEEMPLSDDMSSSLPSQPFLPSIVSISTTSEHPASIDSVNKGQNFQGQTHFEPELCVNMYESVHQHSSVSPDLVGFIPSGEDLRSSSLGTYKSPAYQYTEDSSESLEPKEASQNNKSLVVDDMKPVTKIFPSQPSTLQQTEVFWNSKQYLDSSHEQNTEANAAAVDSSFSSCRSEKGTMECYPISGDENEGMPSTALKGFFDTYQSDTTRAHHLSYAQILAHGLHNKQLNNPPTSHYSHDSNKRADTFVNQSKKDFSHFPDSEESDYNMGSIRTLHSGTSHNMSSQDLQRNIDVLNVNKHYEETTVPFEKSRNHGLDIEGHKFKEDKTDNVVSHSDITLSHNIRLGHASEMEKLPFSMSTEVHKLEIKESNEMKSHEPLLPHTVAIEGEFQDSMKLNDQESNLNLLATYNSTKKKKSKKKKKKKVYCPEDKSVTVLEDENADQENVIGMNEEIENRMISLEKSISTSVDPVPIDIADNIQSKQINEDQLNDKDISFNNDSQESHNTNLLSSSSTKDYSAESKTEKMTTHFPTFHDYSSDHENLTLITPATQDTISQEPLELQFHMTNSNIKSVLLKGHGEDDQEHKEDLFADKSTESEIVSLPSAILEEKQEKRRRKKRNKKKGGNIDEVSPELSIQSMSDASTIKHEETQFSVNVTDSSIGDETYLYEPGVSDQKQITLGAFESTSNTKIEEEFNDIHSYASSDVHTRMKDGKEREETDILQSQNDTEKHPEKIANSKNEGRKRDGKYLKDELNRLKTSRKKIKTRDSQPVLPSALLIKEGEVSSLEDDPENVKQVTDSKHECYEKEISASSTDHTIFESMVHANTDEHLDSEYPSVVKVETNTASVDLSQYSNKSKTNTCSTVFQESEQLSGKVYRKSGSNYATAYQMLNMKIDMLDENSLVSDISSLDFNTSKSDNTLKPMEIDFDESKEGSQQLVPEDRKQESVEPFLQRKKGKSDKKLKEEDNTVVICDPVGSCPLQDSVDSEITSFKEDLSKEKNDDFHNQVHLPVCEDEISKVEITSSVLDISPETELVSPFRETHPHEDIKQEINDSEETLDALSMNENKNSFVEESQHMKSSSLICEMLPSDSQSFNEKDLQAVGKVFTDIATNEEANKEQFDEKNKCSKIDEKSTSICSLVKSSDSSEIIFPSLDKQDEFTKVKYDVSETDDETNKNSNISVSFTRPGKNLPGYEVSFQTPEQIEDQGIFEPISEFHEKNNYQRESLEQLRNQQPVEVFNLNENSVLNLSINERDACDNSFNKKELREKRHSMDNIQRDIDKMSVSDQENESEIAVQWQIVAKSLSREAWPYYLCADAERDWYIQLQKDKTKEIINLPDNEREKYHVTPPQIEVVSAPELKSHDLMVDDTLEGMKEERKSELRTSNYTVDCPRYAISSLLEAERSWREQTAPISISKHDNEWPSSEKIEKTTQLSDIIPPHQNVNEESHHIQTDSGNEIKKENKTEHLLTSHFTLDSSLPKYSASSLLDAERTWKESTTLILKSQDRKELISPENGKISESTNIIHQDQKESLETQLILDCSLPKFNTNALLDDEQSWKESAMLTLKSQDAAEHLSCENKIRESPNTIHQDQTLSLNSQLALDCSLPIYATSALLDAERTWKESAILTLDSQDTKVHHSSENEEISEADDLIYQGQTVGLNSQLVLDSSLPKNTASALLDGEQTWKETVISTLESQDDSLLETEEVGASNAAIYEDQPVNLDTQLILDNVLLTYTASALPEAEITLKESISLVLESQDSEENLAHDSEGICGSNNVFPQDQMGNLDTHLVLDSSLAKYPTSALLDAERTWKELRSFKLQDAEAHPSHENENSASNDVTQKNQKHCLDTQFVSDNSLPKYSASALLDAEQTWKESTTFNFQQDTKDYPSLDNEAISKSNDVIHRDQTIDLDPQLVLDSSLLKYATSALSEAERNWKESSSLTLKSQDIEEHPSNENEICESNDVPHQDKMVSQDTQVVLDSSLPKFSAQALLNTEQAYNDSMNLTWKLQDTVESSSHENKEIQEPNDMVDEGQTTRLDTQLALDSSLPKYATSVLTDAERIWKESTSLTLELQDTKDHSSHENNEISSSKDVMHQDKKTCLDTQLVSDSSLPKYYASALLDGGQTLKESITFNVKLQDTQEQQFHDNKESHESNEEIQDQTVSLDSQLAIDSSLPRYASDAVSDAERTWKESTSLTLESDTLEMHPSHDNKEISVSNDVMHQDQKPCVDAQFVSDSSSPKHFASALLDADQTWKESITFNLKSQDTEEHPSFDNEAISESNYVIHDDQTIDLDAQLALDNSLRKYTTNALLDAERESEQYASEEIQLPCASLQHFQSNPDIEDMKCDILANHLLLDDSFPKYNISALLNAEQNWKELTSKLVCHGEDKEPCSERNKETNESCNVDVQDQIVSQETKLPSYSLMDSQSKIEIEDISWHVLASHLVDDSFWTNKWYFDDAESKWQEQQARSLHSLKSQAVPTTPYEGFCSGYDDQDGEHGDHDIPGAPGVVEWQTEDDGVHLITKKALVSADLEALRSSLEDCEKNLASLSADSLRNMYDDVLKIRDTLKTIDAKTEKLEDIIQQLPTDQDVQNLNFATSNLRQRVTTLLSYTNEGCLTIERIQVQQEQQLQNIAHYEKLLNEIATWCSATTVTLETDLHSLSHNELLEQRTVLDVISQELDQHDKKLNELMASSQLQTHACFELGQSLHQQLKSVRDLLTDVDTQLTHQIAIIKEPVKIKEIETVEMKEEKSSGYQKLHSVNEQESHPASIPDVHPVPDKSPEVADKQAVQAEGDVQALLTSPQKSIPEEEPVEPKIQEDKVAAIHVASQTGDSLREPPPAIRPVSSKDVAVEFHQPVDTQVQTAALTTTIAQMTEDIPFEQHRETIRILKKFDDHEEVVEIATEHPAEHMKNLSALDGEKHKDTVDDGDDNLMVEVKFKGKKASERILHQSVVDPNEISTEVIVEAERRRRIVLKTFHSGGAEVQVVEDSKLDLSKDKCPPKDQQLQLSPSEIPQEDKFMIPEKYNFNQKELSDTQDMDLKVSGRETVELDSSPDKRTIEDYQAQPAIDEPCRKVLDDKHAMEKEDISPDLKETEAPQGEKEEKLPFVGIDLTTDTSVMSSTCQNIPDITTGKDNVKETETLVDEKSEAEPDLRVDVTKYTSLQNIDDHNIEPSEVEKLSPAESRTSLSVSSHMKDTDTADEPATPENVHEELPDDEQYLELTSMKEPVTTPDLDDMSVETSLAESTEIIVSTEGDKNSSDTTKPTELEIVFLDTSSVQSPLEFDSAYSQETGYEPEDLSSEVSVSEKKKRKRKKKVKQTSEVVQTAPEPQVQEQIPEATAVISPHLENIVSPDIEESEKTHNIELQTTLDTVALKDREDTGGEVILISEVHSVELLKKEDSINEVPAKSDDIEEQKVVLDIPLHNEKVISPCVMTDSSVQATVQVAVETVQTISPESFSPQYLERTDIIPVVALSEIHTQTSPVPETSETAMQTLSPVLETHDFQTCSTQVSPVESDNEGTTANEITHSATQVAAETEESYMQTSPIEQVISDVVNVSLQTVIDTCETHDSFVQTSPEPDVQTLQNIDLEVSTALHGEKISPESQESQLSDIQETKDPLQATVSPAIETVHSSMQTTDIPAVSCESQTSPDTYLMYSEEIPTATVSMQPNIETASVDNYMQTSPVISLETETINTSMQTETRNTGNISTQADIELPSEGITVDIQTNKEELNPSVEISMQTDAEKFPIAETIDTISQTVQSGSGTTPGLDSCIQTTVSELIPSTEDSTQTNIQSSTVIDSSVQTNEIVWPPEPTPQFESESKEPQTEKAKGIDEQEKNESSSEEQLEVQIHASIAFPTERTTTVVQKSVGKQTSPFSQDDSKLNISTHVDKTSKKKHKKKSKRSDKSSTSKKPEASKKLLIAEVEQSTDATPTPGDEIHDFKMSVQFPEHIPDEKESSVPKYANDEITEEDIIVDLVSDPDLHPEIQDLTKCENVSGDFEKQDAQLVILPEDNDEIVDREIKHSEMQIGHLTYKSEGSFVASAPNLSDEIEDPTLKIKSQPTTANDDISKSDLIIDTEPIKDEIETSEHMSEISLGSTSQKLEIIPPAQRKRSIEKSELITAEECYQREACFPRENEWKQVQCLVTDRVRKLQKEQHTTHLSGVLYLATLQQIVADESFEQKNNTVQHDLNTLRDAVNSEDRAAIQRSVITIVETVSTWLESIEYHVLLTCQHRTAPTKDHITELGNLKQEIVSVGQKVEDLDSVMEFVYTIFDGDEASNMKQCISSLQNQVVSMKEVTDDKEQQATKDLNRWEEFLNGVNNVSVLIEELKEQLDQVVETNLYVQSKLEMLDQFESTNHSHQQKTTQLMNNARALLCDFPGHEVPPELYGAYETTRSIEHTVKLERDRQLQLIALADEYEQTLKEFAQIIDVADALVESSIVVSSLEYLQEEMQKHRKFFVNLSHCRSILESLEGNLATETRNKHSELHQQLHTRASGILDKAAGRAQQMALAASRWTVLEQGMKEERNWLQVAHQRVPDLQSVTSTDYDQYISLYQSLSADVAVHHGHCAQLIEVARRLQELVLCPGLEARYDEHLEVIAKLQDDINKNLHCLLSFRDTWRNYMSLIEKLDHWMKYAEKELESISSEDQHPGTNMRHFWELKAQYEVHNNIRNEASSNFNAVMRIIPVADENLQCQLHAKLEERWRNVSSQIQNIQTAVLEILSNQEVPVKDKLAALQQELRELQSALNDSHKVIKKEEELELYIQRMQVMLGCVEHIQEELSRLGLLSMDETEKVGILLCGAGNIELQVREELEAAILLREKINAIQKGLNRVRRSYEHASNVLDQCEKGVNQGQDAVEQALNNCQGVCDELPTLWQDVMDLRQLLHTLPMSLHLSISPIHLERNITQFQDRHQDVETRSAHLLSLLKNRLGMWQHFEQQLELVQQSVQETDYMMELLTVQGSVDYDRLVKATECLEGLYGSLDQREDLLDELRGAAAPLAETCAAEVSAKIKVAVEDVEKSWNNTRQTLRELCERYQDAARLWRQYREASDCVKTWAEQQLDSTAHLSAAEALHHVKVCEETLQAHQARLGDLRGLVAQIAADVGLDADGPLADDVAALGRRLEEVKESLALLAEVAEAQQIGQDELQSTCDFLASVKQSLSKVEEANEKDIEKQLGALRNHLLALGKTEGQLQTFKERSIDLSPSKSETSVVEILQLWQQVFRETFQHYHRLSARLVKSQDSAAALRLWHEYLLHVQSFLSSSIPEDYRGLTEHQHLCEVHQNLLMSQQSVLLSQNEGRTHQDGVELSVIEQFNSLTNLHNETLARIMERHSEVGARLVSWEKYSQEQARLLTWLRDIERERSRLQLHNIHTRRIPKVLLLIQTMLEEKVPLGESQAQELLELQNSLFHNTDDTVAASVRLEYAAISQRISNLKAALETWKDHLDRINNLADTYEKNATTVQTVFQEIHSTICESQHLISHADIRSRLDSLRNLRSRMSCLTSDLETMNVTLEQLRECLSPMDMKTLNQRTWLLWQSHNDLDHQLAVICHQLEERINLHALFETRRSRFLVWVEDMKHRLDQICIGDPEEVLSRIQTEIQGGDMALKCREVDWLLSTGHELIAATSGDDENSTTEKNDLEEKLADIQTSWEDLQNLAANKVNKLKNILQNLSQLEQQLSELRTWCHQIETQLMKPLVISECTDKVFHERLQEIEELQNTIEQQSGNVAEILNVSELLLSDYELVKTTINTESISIATEAVEKRWKHICEVSAERKCNFLHTWKLLKNLLKGCEEKQQWIQIQEDILGDMQRNINQISPFELQEQLSRVKGVLEELQSQKKRLVILDHSYSQLVKSCRMVPDNLSPTTSLIHFTLQRWHALTPMATTLDDRLRQEHKMYRDFVNIHGKAVTNLTELDVRLTQLQHLHSPHGASSSIVSQEIIEQLERELKALNSLLQTADSLGMALLQKCKEGDQIVIHEMIDEYQLLRRDITKRLAALKAKHLNQHGTGASQIKEKDESIQVETLRFEQDTAIQVNTLPHLTGIAPQNLRGFDTAIAECKSNLATLKEVLEETPTDGSKLATALAGSQSSIDLVRHLSAHLGERSEVTEEQRRTSEVAELCSEYERLCSLACIQHQNAGENSESARLTCPLCSQFNWHQLDNDLWRLEQWLQFSEGTQSSYQVPPTDIEQLEDTIQDHREFLMDLDGHKNIVMSLNIVGTHLADHADDQDKAEALRSRLEKTNMRWEAVCQVTAHWQSQLQHALMENPGFHRIIEELMEWLEKTEGTIRLAEPIDLAEENSVVEAKYNKFRELHEELERCEPRVMSLQDAADQLLRQSDAPENSVLTRLTSLRLRLQSLRRITGIYVLKLGAVLGHDPSELGLVASHRAGSGQNVAGASLVRLSQELLDQAAAASSIHTETRHSNDNGTPREDEVDTTVLTRGYRFFGRVLRASLPIQALMLLILGVASLVPSREEDYSCILSNNLANSFEPLLFYPNGPPPV